MFIRLLCVSAVASALPGRKHASAATTLAVAHEELADIDAELDAELDAERKGSSSGFFDSKRLDGLTLNPSTMTCPTGWEDDDIRVTMQMGTKGSTFGHQSLVFKLTGPNPEAEAQCYKAHLLEEQRGSIRRIKTQIEHSRDDPRGTSVRRIKGGKIYSPVLVPLEGYTSYTLNKNKIDGLEDMEEGKKSQALHNANVAQCERACSSYFADKSRAAPDGYVKGGPSHSPDTGGPYDLYVHGWNGQTFTDSCKCEHIEVFECDSKYPTLEGQDTFPTTKSQICAAFNQANYAWAGKNGNPKKYQFFWHNCQTWRKLFHAEVQSQALLA